MSGSSSLVSGIPSAELLSMRLDGEVFPLGAGWFPVDLPDSPGLRISAVMAGRSSRLIAGGTTAAWVWGAASVLPTPLTLLSDVRARARLRPGSPAVVREVTLAEGEIAELGDGRVTTPLRTLLDLACEGAPADVLRRLASVADLDRDEVLSAARRERRPGVQAARRAISAALSRC